MARPKLEMFRWSAETVQRELGHRRHTFLRRAAEANITPDAEGRFTSRQIFDCLTGNIRQRIDAKRLELLEEQMQKLALENARTRAETANVDDVYHTYEPVFITIRQHVIASHLSEEEKRDLLSSMQFELRNARPVEGLRSREETACEIVKRTNGQSTTELAKS